jgi:phenylpyruvate tautomerase PptA (4-oxalocrotonate tautomerase family)
VDTGSRKENAPKQNFRRTEARAAVRATHRQKCGPRNAAAIGAPDALRPKAQSGGDRETKMPTYFCSAPVGLLDAGKKSAIAAAITRIHNAVTGAASFFAQVIFTDVAKGNHFMGGVPLASDQIFVHGFIRAGRSVADRERLVTGMVSSLAELSGLPKKSVWVYVSEIPARQMAEYGHVLPEPGDEKAWLEGLPPEDRAYMQSIGK